MFQSTEISKKHAHVPFVPLEMTMISDSTRRNDYKHNSDLFVDQSSFQSGAEQAPLTNQSNSSWSVSGHKSHRRIARVNRDEDNRPVHSPKPKLPRRTSINKENTARATKLSEQLIGPDPKQSFTVNCVETISDWVTLLRQTTFTSAVTSSDPCVIAAFKAVDKIILGKEATYLLRRLAYVQLRRVFTTLEAILRSEKERNQVRRQPRRHDVSVAIDIYMIAQVEDTNSSVSRSELLERRRVSRAWEYLAGPSPLLTLIYSEAADPIVRDLWRKDSASLKSVVASILQDATWAVRIGARLTHSAIWAVNCGHPSVIREAAMAEIEQVLSQQIDDGEVYENLDEYDTGDDIESSLRGSTSRNTLTMSSISAPSHWTHPVVEPGFKRDDDTVPSGSSQWSSLHLTPSFGHYPTKLHFSFASYATAVINDNPRRGSYSQAGMCVCELQRPRQIRDKQKNIIRFIQTHLPAFNLGQAVVKTSTNSPTSIIDQVRTWKTAQEHTIDTLTKLAYENLVWELVYWVMSEQTFVPIFGDLVRYVYSRCTAESGRLRHVLAQFAACVVEDVCLLDGWHELITEEPAFRRDMLYKLADRCV